jgi:hypothetical protein
MAGSSGRPPDDGDGVADDRARLFCHRPARHRHFGARHRHFGASKNVPLLLLRAAAAHARMPTAVRMGAPGLRVAAVRARGALRAAAPAAPWRGSGAAAGRRGAAAAAQQQQRLLCAAASRGCGACTHNPHARCHVTRVTASPPVRCCSAAR